VPRKLLVLATLMAVPFVVLVFVASNNSTIRLLALAMASVGLAAAASFEEAQARRIRTLAAFVDSLLSTEAQHPALSFGDDDLGGLARSLSRAAPRIAELVSNLSIELARRETVLASMTDAVLAVDAQLHVTFCNHSFVHALGDHDVAEGIPLIHLVRDPSLLGVLKQVVDSGEPARARIQLSNPEGRTFEVNAAPLTNSAAPAIKQERAAGAVNRTAGSQPVRRPGKESRGAIAILHDITPQERLERIKRDFIANVSHEFRTPLATIRGYAETLLEGGLEDRENRRKFVEIIQANGLRLNNIAADLLALSELEAGRPGPEPGPVPVSDAVGAALHAVEPAAALRGLSVRAEPIPNVSILGYGIRLEQALVNLLDNAVKFNRENGEVRVEVRDQPDGHVQILVSDTGVGIPAHDLSRIFERFYRVDKARSRQVGGTGLGLSIVKHAIEQMHGTIAVESQMGEGSTFTITLPRFPNGLESRAR
jgi:two-component system, OmpR family, phosphate regulon sensor histidine kinase PhoR